PPSRLQHRSNRPPHATRLRAAASISFRRRLTRRASRPACPPPETPTGGSRIFRSPHCLALSAWLFSMVLSGPGDADQRQLQTGADLLSQLMFATSLKRGWRSFFSIRLLAYLHPTKKF